MRVKFEIHNPQKALPCVIGILLFHILVMATAVISMRLAILYFC